MSIVVAQSLSYVRLFAIPWTAAHQAPLSLGFPRQEYWGRLPCHTPDLPNPGIELTSLASLTSLSFALTGKFFTTVWPRKPCTHICIYNTNYFLVKSNKIISPLALKKTQCWSVESKCWHLYFFLFGTMQNIQPNKSTHSFFIIDYGDYARMMCFIINKLVFLSILVTNVKMNWYGIYVRIHKRKQKPQEEFLTWNYFRELVFQMVEDWMGQQGHCGNPDIQQQEQLLSRKEVGITRAQKLRESPTEIGLRSPRRGWPHCC